MRQFFFSSFRCCDSENLNCKNVNNSILQMISREMQKNFIYVRHSNGRKLNDEEDKWNSFETRWQKSSFVKAHQNWIEDEKFHSSRRLETWQLKQMKVNVSCRYFTSLFVISCEENNLKLHKFKDVYCELCIDNQEEFYKIDDDFE